MHKNTSKTDGEHVNILNVRVDSTSEAGVLAKISQKLTSGLKFYIVTPNPEIILQAEGDPKLLQILNSADFSIPDGFGLRIAEPSLTIIRGRELMLDLCKLAREKNWKVFLLGGKKGISQKAALSLKRKFPGLKVDWSDGFWLNNEANPVSEVDRKSQSDTLDKIGIIRPDILFVGFGAPKQEKWIAKWLPKLPVKCAMVVGGALDYLAGTAKLPPAWMEEAGFEWLWRFIVEPWRAPRIIKALIIFPMVVIYQKINQSFSTK